MPVTAEQKDRLFKAADAGQLEDFQATAAELGGDDIKQLKADNGADCLHIAAHGGRTELCKYLLEQLHFDVNAQQGTGSTPLALAIAKGHVETAELLLSHGADVNRCGSGDGSATPLHLAVAGEQLGLVSQLLAAGADVNAPSGSGTPLMLAAARSNAPLIEALLAAGADVHVKSRQGITPLFMAAALGSSAECARVLTKAGADVNARALGAFTPLHVAAEGGKLELAEALLQAGADPDAQDEHGHTPARAAAMHGHRAVVELLLRRAGSGASGASSSEGASSGASGASGSGAAAGPSGSVEEFMRSSKAELAAREEKTTSSSGSGATVVRVPEPECPDEALSDTFKRKGNEFFAAGDYAGAAKLYDIALSHWTKNAVVWGNRSACFLRLDKHEKALQDAQIARALDPSYVKAWYREGRAAAGLQRWEDAASAFYQAAALQPENEEFLRLTKEAIQEGRKELAAQQRQGGAAAPPAALSAAGSGGDS